MVYLKDVLSYAKFPKWKTRMIRIQLFLIFFLYFILLGIRSVISLNIDAVYCDLGKNSFYVCLKEENLQECNDFVKRVYPDVKETCFVTDNAWIIYENVNSSKQYSADKIIHSNDFSTFSYYEFNCQIDLFQDSIESVIIYDKFAEEIFGFSDERLSSKKVNVYNRIEDSDEIIFNEYPISGVYHLKEIDTIITSSINNGTARTIFHYTNNFKNCDGEFTMRYTSSAFNDITDYNNMNRLLGAAGFPSINRAYIYSTYFHMKTAELINMLLDFSFSFSIFTMTCKIFILYILKLNHDCKIFYTRNLLGESNANLFKTVFFSLLYIVIPLLCLGFLFSIIFKVIIESYTILIFPSISYYFIHFGIVLIASIILMLLLSGFSILQLNGFCKKKHKSSPRNSLK